jgi:diadenosine tetraphosphate (Ap4A) HIT family hydrolase
VFCEIAAGREPASFVHEDDDVIAFMDIQPINPGAVVVTPRRHVPSLAELDETTGGRLFDVAVRLQLAVRRCGVRCEGINLFLSDGESAGQDVFHTHLLVVPRFAGDTLRITCEWPEPRPRRELDAVAASIRQAAD